MNKQKGSIVKSFLIILVIIILMVALALFVRRKNEPKQELLVEPQEELIDHPEQEVDNELEMVQDEVVDSEIVAKAKNDLSQRKQAQYQEISLVEIKEEVFSDYTLGISRPGEIVPQTPAKGYVITLSLRNQNYLYHADQSKIVFIE